MPFWSKMHGPAPAPAGMRRPAGGSGAKRFAYTGGRLRAASAAIPRHDVQPEEVTLSPAEPEPATPSPSPAAPSPSPPATSMPQQETPSPVVPMVPPPPQAEPASPISLPQDQPPSTSATPNTDPQAANAPVMPLPAAPQETGTGTPAAATVTGEGALPICFGSAYIHKGKLCLMGACRTKLGTLPTLVTHPVSPQFTSGPVHIGEDTHPAIHNALRHIEKKIMMKAQDGSQGSAAENLVRRARQGDQNAMAIICSVRDEAKKKNPKARSAFQALRNFIRLNPPSTMGAEPAPTPRIMSFAACIDLANGPPLDDTRIEDIAVSFGAEAHLFLHGVQKYKHDGYLSRLMRRVGLSKKPVLDLAKSVGTARSIQNVRKPNSRISFFSPMIGWEMGE